MGRCARGVLQDYQMCVMQCTHLHAAHPDALSPGLCGVLSHWCPHIWRGKLPALVARQWGAHAGRSYIRSLLSHFGTGLIGTVGCQLSSNMACRLVIGAAPCLPPSLHGVASGLHLPDGF
jgi:hypothetical protein